MSVFEYGSGGSTLFIAKKTQAVISTEDNPIWLEKVKERLEREALSNVVMQHFQFDPKNPQNFQHSDYLDSIPAKKFDVIVVDGTEEYFGQQDAARVRPFCFRHAEEYIKPGGIIVLDDSWYYPELRGANRAKNCRIFQSVGPCRPGVTSTGIFFY
jgi:spermidine synthase